METLDQIIGEFNVEHNLHNFDIAMEELESIDVAELEKAEEEGNFEPYFDPEYMELYNFMSMENH